MWWFLRIGSYIENTSSGKQRAWVCFPCNAQFHIEFLWTGLVPLFTKLQFSRRSNPPLTVWCGYQHCERNRCQVASNNNRATLVCVGCVYRLITVQIVFPCCFASFYQIYREIVLIAQKSYTFNKPVQQLMKPIISNHILPAIYFLNFEILEFFLWSESRRNRICRFAAKQELML